MIRNFHFKMLFGIAIFAFVMSFIYLSSGIRYSSDRVGAPIGGLFSVVGFFAAITAVAIRSINRRLDHAGIAEDPEHPTSKACLTKKNAQQAGAGQPATRSESKSKSKVIDETQPEPEGRSR